MTVKDVIALASKMAKEDEVVKLCQGKAPTDSDYAVKTYDTFMDCYNIITDELATEYYPLKIKSEFLTEDGKIEFSSFPYTPLRIVGVTDENGNKLAYKLINDYLSVDKCGKIVVNYVYRPKKGQDDDEAVYANNIIGPYVLSYGIVSEFMMMKGDMAESNIWQEKYMNGIRGKIAERRKLVIPVRRW